LRITLMPVAVAVLFGLAAPAYAQSGTTQTPPAPNSTQSAPAPLNSVPAGSMTTNPSAPGGGSPTIGAQTGTTGSAQPAAPSGSTNNDPSGAFKQTVPQPATTGTAAPR